LVFQVARIQNIACEIASMGFGPTVFFEIELAGPKASGPESARRNSIFDPCGCSLT